MHVCAWLSATEFPDYRKQCQALLPPLTVRPDRKFVVTGQSNKQYVPRNRALLWNYHAWYGAKRWNEIYTCCKFISIFMLVFLSLTCYCTHSYVAKDHANPCWISRGHTPTVSLYIYIYKNISYMKYYMKLITHPMLLYRSLESFQYFYPWCIHEYSIAKQHWYLSDCAWWNARGLELVIICFCFLVFYVRISFEYMVNTSDTMQYDSRVRLKWSGRDFRKHRSQKEGCLILFAW